MNPNRGLVWRSLASVTAYALAGALPARAEDPKPAVQAAPVVAAPALPASAFQAAQVLLGKLEELDPRGERLALASLEASRVAPSKERGESVAIEVELVLTASDPEQSRAAADEWIRLVKQEKAVVDARVRDSDAGQPSASARRVRVHVDCDPSKASQRDVKREGATSKHDSRSYIWKQATMDRVDIGAVQTTAAARRIPGTDWVEERWTIRSPDHDKERRYHRARIRNYAIVLERDHPYTVVTRYSMLPAAHSCADYGMELELTLLRPARADELEGTSRER